MPGKPSAKIDINDLNRLAQLHCTIEEAAAFFGCTELTIKRRLRKPEYREAWERGREYGKHSLRRLQWKHANGAGSSAVQMTIHLSKHWLGESDKSLVELSGRGVGSSIVNNIFTGPRLDLSQASPETIAELRQAALEAIEKDGGKLLEGTPYKVVK